MKLTYSAMLLALWLPLAACSADEPVQTSAIGDPGYAAATDSLKAEEGVETRPTEPERKAEPSDSAPAQKDADREPVAEPQVQRIAAAETKFVEGEHYQRIVPTQPTSSGPDKIEVAEAFMYTCPHCNSFEPHVSDWLERKPAGVSFVRIPVNFNSVAALHLQAYYVADTLGVLEHLHERFFREIHVNRNMMRTRESIADFFVKNGVAREDFDGTWDSFAVDTKMRRAESMARRYGVRSVPAVIVNGKYKTDGSMAGSYPRLLEVIDYLVSLEAGAIPQTPERETAAETG